MSKGCGARKHLLVVESNAFILLLQGAVVWVVVCVDSGGGDDTIGRNGRQHGNQGRGWVLVCV